MKNVNLKSTTKLMAVLAIAAFDVRAGRGPHRKHTRAPAYRRFDTRPQAGAARRRPRVADLRRRGREVFHADAPRQVRDHQSRSQPHLVRSVGFRCAGKEQSARFALDGSQRQGLRHPRNQRSVFHRQGRVAWMRADAQTGFGRAVRDGDGRNHGRAARRIFGIADQDSRSRGFRVRFRRRQERSRRTTCCY